MSLLKRLLKHLTLPASSKVVVACADDEEVLLALSEAQRWLDLEITLVGDLEKIQALLQKHDQLFKKVRLLEADHPVLACTLALREALAQGAILMKGMVDTKILLKVVLNEPSAVPQEGFLSHCSLAYLPSDKKLRIISDAGLNVEPTLDSWVRMVDNAVTLARCLKISPVYVALLSAVEKVNPKIASSQRAQDLMQRYAQRWPDDVHVEGPYALDNAINPFAAKRKGVSYVGAGKAQVLMVPNIESGNILIKALVHLAQAESAGIVMGANVPMVVTSRSDSAADKVHSIILACGVAAHG
jgi:phosphate butyryltransferase